MTPVVLTIDCSTTSSKAMAWDETGLVISEARREIPFTIPSEGYGEQDPRVWWTASKDALCEVVRSIDAAAIVAVSITHQRESFACLDRHHEPLRPAMLWLDTRAKEQVEVYGDEDIHRITGKPVNPTPAFYKVLWMKQHEPDLLARTVHLVDVHAYLSHRLIGRYVSPAASVDPLGFLNLMTDRYDEHVLALAGITTEQLPEICHSGDVIGEIESAVREELGLPNGVLLVAGGGDGQCAGLGAGVAKPGAGYLNLGTGLIAGLYSDTYQPSMAYRAMAGTIPHSYNYEFFIGAGTYMINWFRDHMDLGPGRENPEAYWGEQAEQIPIGSGGLFTLPYWNGALTPYWDQNASGAIIGFSGVHGNAHLYRSILEGIAFELRLCMEMAAPNLAESVQHLIAMGGGTKTALWCQILADNLGIPILISRAPEATSLGAAMLASVGAELYDSVTTAASEMSGVGRSFEPIELNRSAYQPYFDAYKQLYPALSGPFTAIRRIVS